MKDNLRSTIRKSDLYAPLRRWRLSQTVRQPGYLPDWATLIEGNAAEWMASVYSARGPKVCIASSLGMHSTINTIDSLIAVALTLRGARVEILLCDGRLPACQLIEHTLVPSVRRAAQRGPQADFCAICTDAGNRVYTPLGLPVRSFGDYLCADDMLDSDAFASDHHNSELDEHALAGALRFFGKSTLGNSDAEIQILNRYRQAAFLVDRAAQRLFEERGYDVVVAHHGIYVPQGQIARAARAAGKRLVTWHPAYRRSTLIYQHRDTYHREMIAEPESRWGPRPLTEAEDNALERYLTERETGATDWIRFQRQAPQPERKVWDKLKLDPSKSTFLLAANVAWDARLHYPGSAYGDMIAWTHDTVDWFSRHPERQLIIRCHPGEIMNSPRAQQRLDDAIQQRWPQMPPNIRVITPEMTDNTYGLAKICRALLIYNTKLGVEIAARGLPVIVAGDAWIRGKGFSHDATDRDSYLCFLENAEMMVRLSASEQDRARRYAYHFFFRRCIPVSALDPNAGWPLTTLASGAFAAAHPGADPGIDTICSGILTGTPFEYKH
ncbi:hypothetical protein [Hyphomonas sp.]|uniref:hypothetical protein n=1 Tax=Hyphomonas sp. TaxID=87 RepID=UPI001BCC4555|nr:hypothetical protein [Hyphomonas sp.]